MNQHHFTIIHDTLYLEEVVDAVLSEFEESLDFIDFDMPTERFPSDGYQGLIS